MAPTRTIDSDRIAEGRRLYVETDMPLAQIARGMGLSARTLRRRIEDWGWPLRAARHPRAFSSEVGPGSREENAMKQRVRSFPRFEETRKRSRAFSDQVDAGWSPETATKQKVRATSRSNRDAKGSEGSANMALVEEAPPSAAVVPDLPDSGPGRDGLDQGDGSDRLDLARRLERTALRQIMAMEARLARRGLKPQTDAEQERAARTLAVLARVLRDSQSLRAAQSRTDGEGEDDGNTRETPPRDLDALRDALAERLESMARARRAERGAGGL